MKEYQQGVYTISTDPARLQVDAIHGYLSRSYWAAGRTREAVAKSLPHSLCFGVYRGDEQVGLARVLTDYVVYAYLMDVYILEAHQGQGLGKWLIATVTAYPDLQGVRRWTLATRDAHELYRQFGFRELAEPGRWMERFNG